jgi:hypothetical protein
MGGGRKKLDFTKRLIVKQIQVGDFMYSFEIER